MRVALSSYRSKPHSGGQGIYVRNLSRELVALGHDVEVFSGQPYPVLDPGVRLTPVPSLDLYRDDDPFRTPHRREFRDLLDVYEFATMCTGGFPEPWTFGQRLARLLRGRTGEFDILHDNQTLAPGILAAAAGARLPLVTSIHHPISADRRVELANAAWYRRPQVARWYSFVRMQRRVAQRLEHILTVSERSAIDVAADFGVAPHRLRVIPVGVDVDLFAPPTVARVPGRVVTVSSADVAVKGLAVLMRAMAQAETGHLIVVGRPSVATESLVAGLGLGERVRFVSGLSGAALAELMASAEIAVVPSLYEGFSLPAVEAMSCGTPLVASAVGALPELIGSHSERGVLVKAGDTVDLGRQITELLRSPERRARMGEAGRRTAVELYSWRGIAVKTADRYAEIVSRHRSARPAAKRTPA